MSENHDAQLQEVAESTFETLAFLLVMPDDEAPQGEDPQVVARVNFAGPFSGTLYLSVSEETVPMLATNMLGMEDIGPTPGDGQQYDALKELLNVVCGNLLPEIAGTAPVFDVSAPEVTDRAEIPAECEGLAPIANASMVLDCGTARLTLFVDANAPICA